MRPMDKDIFYQLVSTLEVEMIIQHSFECGQKQMLES